MIVAWYEDAGVSGSVSLAKRRGFSSLLDALDSEHTEITTIVAADFSRFSRGVVDDLHALSQSRALQFITVDQAEDESFYERMKSLYEKQLLAEGWKPPKRKSSRRAA